MHDKRWKNKFQLDRLDLDDFDISDKQELIIRSSRFNGATSQSAPKKPQAFEEYLEAATKAEGGKFK